VAGFPNVSVIMDITILEDGTFSGTYEMGANGELPTGQSIVYDINGELEGLPTATPTSEPTPSDTPSPTSPGAGLPVRWGNNNCSGDGDDPPDPVDSLIVLRHDGGLSTNTGDCPDMGTAVSLLVATALTWGDVDCSGSVNPVDSLKILRFDGGLEVAQETGCPEMGDTVTLAGG
jgi:hypothetical protein